MINLHAINGTAVNAAPPPAAIAATHALSAHAGCGFRAGAAAHGMLNCAAAAGYGFAAGAAAIRKMNCAAAAGYGFAAGCAAPALCLRASVRHGFRAAALALRLHGPFFGWGEGVGYRVVRADQAPGGLEQGGIKRDALMGGIQRMGL
jgi:hypothetical protein